MNTSKEIMELLQYPFKDTEIEWRVGSTNADKTKGLALAYVTNRAIQNRLDDIFGVFGWRNEFKEWKATSQICGISIWSDERQAWITKWDGSDDSATEAVKGGLSDSMKRCGYQWGIGRYLYNLPSTWMPLKNKKYLDGIPKLPAWALPKGNNKTTTDDNKPTEPQIQGDAEATITVKMLLDMALSKGYDEEKVCKRYKVSEAKYIKKDDKKLAYEGFKALPNKGGN